MGLNYNDQAPGETNANTDATDSTMDINDNAQEPEKKLNEVNNDQYATSPAQVYISPEQKRS